MDIARDSLDIVAWALTELLDKLHKVRSMHDTWKVHNGGILEHRCQRVQDDRSATVTAFCLESIIHRNGLPLAATI